MNLLSLKHGLHDGHNGMHSKNTKSQFSTSKWILSLTPQFIAYTPATNTAPKEVHNYRNKLRSCTCGACTYAMMSSIQRGASYDSPPPLIAQLHSTHVMHATVRWHSAAAPCARRCVCRWTAPGLFSREPCVFPGLLEHPQCMETKLSRHLGNPTSRYQSAHHNFTRQLCLMLHATRNPAKLASRAPAEPRSMARSTSSQVSGRCGRLQPPQIFPACILCASPRHTTPPQHMPCSPGMYFDCQGSLPGTYSEHMAQAKVECARPCMQATTEEIIGGLACRACSRCERTRPPSCVWQGLGEEASGSVP
jgi:hypothetical protein